VNDGLAVDPGRPEALAAALAAELAGALEDAGAAQPRLALVLGSGLGAFADGLEGAVAVPFEALPSMPSSTVPGHAGRFVAGVVSGVQVLCQQGRVHLYEGHCAEVVTRAVRALPALGVRSVLLTNAAGGLAPGWPVPCLMRIRDHLNMQGVVPPIDGRGRQARVYDEAVGRALSAAGEAQGIDLREGVYAGLAGPTYETAAEIRMLDRVGAQAVGMSTVLEAKAAAGAGLRVGAVSCITNPAAGIAVAPLHHEEVVEAGRQIAGDFARLLGAAIPAIGAL
jgi:purine-nucleoside phosphorylase